MRILECKIFYMQPDRWVFLLRGTWSAGHAQKVLEQRKSVLSAEHEGETNHFHPGYLVRILTKGYRDMRLMGDASFRLLFEYLS